MSESGSSSTEYPPLNDVLASHLTGCAQCQESLKRKPVGNLEGHNDTHCAEWWQVIEEWSRREGYVNNVVAHDEHGNQARTSPLWAGESGPCS